jgi:copper resistance protein C
VSRSERGPGGGFGSCFDRWHYEPSDRPRATVYGARHARNRIVNEHDSAAPLFAPRPAFAVAGTEELECSVPSQIDAVAAHVHLWDLMYGMRKFFLAFSLFCFTSLLFAHAILVTSEPASGQSLSGPDVNIKLRFNSRIDVKRSRITLVASGGERRMVTLDEQTSPDSLSSHVQGLKTGAYLLQWQVLAVDGHISRGEVPFTVR